jgi:hypothetical protein
MSFLSSVLDKSVIWAVNAKVPYYRFGFIRFNIRLIFILFFIKIELLFSLLFTCVSMKRFIVFEQITIAYKDFGFNALQCL